MEEAQLEPTGLGPGTQTRAANQAPPELLSECSDPQGPRFMPPWEQGIGVENAEVLLSIPSFLCQHSKLMQSADAGGKMYT